MKQLRFGVHLPHWTATHDVPPGAEPAITADFDLLLDTALRCEALGFSSVWLSDHVFDPARPGDEVFEAWTMLTAVLARTTSLRAGHLVLNNNLRHPALLAKMAVTLDHVSQGRLNLGIGSGSIAEEHEALGLTWGTLGERSVRLAESLRTITGMFDSGVGPSPDANSSARAVPCLPVPAQTPRPPIYVGGTSRTHTFPVVACYADVWNVFGLDPADPDRRRALADLDRACESVERDPATLGRSVAATLVLARDEPAVANAREQAGRDMGWGPSVLDWGVVGTPAQVVEKIGGLVEAGFEEFVFLQPSHAAQEECLALLAEEVVPAFR